MTEKPLCYELYAGLHGWGEGAVAAGFRCIGFDIADMNEFCGIPRPASCELVIRDVRSIHGAELKDADLIVGSSPCQEFSYRAMPWTRAKALGPPSLGMELFNAQFRIQREASEAAGRHIPMVVENVRGAQKWVGRAAWHYGSYYLWGDVPALMPISFSAVKVPSFRFDGSGQSFQSAASKQVGGWFGKENPNSIMRLHSSKSPLRKIASALIAKIPFDLAFHIAKTYYPHPKPIPVNQGKAWSGEVCLDRSVKDGSGG